MRKPTSVGEILLEEFLKPLKITQRRLAKHIDCDYKVINRIVNNKSSLSTEIAIKLSYALNTSPEFWLRIQIATDIYKKIDTVKEIKPIKRGNYLC